MQEVNTNIKKFTPVPWLNAELEVKGIYLIGKLMELEVDGDGDFFVQCGFPPKIVQANCQEASQASTGSSDFTLSFSIRSYNNAGVFATQETSNLVYLSTMTAVVSKRAYNGFYITVSWFSWANKNIYFTCYS